MRTPLCMKNTRVFQRKHFFRGLNLFPLRLPSVFMILSLRQSTLALPFPFCFRAPYNVKQKSVDLDEEDVPFSPDEHKKRYALQVTTFFLQGQ